MISKFRLYSSDGCHLCEQAHALCLPLFEQAELTVIDIVEDDKLVELYGVHIPVFERLSDNKKLFWPFTQQQVRELI